MDIGSSQVSVVIPVRNRAHTVRGSIESVVKQSVAPGEVIVVDDGSSDDTVSVVKAASTALADICEVRVIRNRESIGANGCRNKGVSAARFKWIAFNDSDDLWRKEKLAKQLTALAQTSRPECTIVYSDFRKVYGRGDEYRSVSHENYAGSVLDELTKGNFISTQTVVGHRQLFTRFKFDEKLQRFQDWELWLRMSQDCDFVSTGEVHVDVYESASSISTDASLVYPAIRHILSTHESIFASYPLQYAEYLRYCVKYCAKNRMPLDFAGNLRTYLAIDRAGRSNKTGSTFLTVEDFHRERLSK